MREPRHILILVENLSVPFDRRVWHECTTLVAAGYEVSVICPRGKRHDRKPFAEIDGVRILRYPQPPSARSLAGYVGEYSFMLAWTLYLAVRLWRRRPFDVIHACNPPDLFFLIGCVFRPCGVAFVFDQHDANPEILLAKRGGEARHALPERIVAWAERSTYALADIVIAPNSSYRRLALTRGRKRLEDVIVVRSGPLRHEFDAGGREQPYDRRGHRYLVGYLGVMGKQDGVDLLVKAVAKLVAAGDDILLYLAGDGESYEEIRSLAAGLGIADRVDMPGFQTFSEFESALRSADVCAAPDPPTAFNEISTMNKIVEYMALGRPGVAFDLPENRLSGGAAVAYASEPTADGLAAAIHEVLHDEQWRDEMAREAKRRFDAELAWEHSAPHLCEAYERLRAKLSGDMGGGVFTESRGAGGCT